MKICVLTHTFPRNKEDVAAAYMKEFCDGLVLAGNKVTVLTPYDPKFFRKGDSFKVFTYKYIWPDKFHVLGYSRTMEGDIKLKTRAFFLLPFLVISGSVSLLNIIRKEKIDLISVHWILPNGLIALIASKLTGVPFTITFPGTDTYLVKKYKMFSWVAKLIATNAAALFSNSSWHLDSILNLGVNAKIAEIITYPVDTAKFRPIKGRFDKYRKRHLLKKTDFVILAVGRLVYKKGFNYLIEAMPNVINKYPNVKLIIGGDGDLYNEWDDLVLKLGLEKKVIFARTMKRDEILYYYNLANIMVTPSIIDQQGNIDGRPLVTLESIACGKPQIVTKLPGISDDLKEGVNALLIPQKDSKAITNALIKLIKLKSLREKMGKQNRLLAEAKFNTRYIGGRYTKFFKRILQK